VEVFKRRALLVGVGEWEGLGLIQRPASPPSLSARPGTSGPGSVRANRLPGLLGTCISVSGSQASHPHGEGFARLALFLQLFACQSSAGIFMLTLHVMFCSLQGGHRGSPQPHAASAAPGPVLMLDESAEERRGRRRRVLCHVPRAGEALSASLMGPGGILLRERRGGLS